MSYVESNLVPGETVIYQTRLHWIVMLGHIVLGACCSACQERSCFITRLANTELRANTLHMMEGGGVALLVCGAW